MQDADYWGMSYIYIKENSIMYIYIYIHMLNILKYSNTPASGIL